MSLNDSNKLSFIAIILFIALMTVISYAEPPSTKSNSEEGMAVSNAKIPETIENHLQSLNDRVEKLEDNEEKSKDFWDKFASVSTFLSGVIIALIGIYATSVYNQRQLDSQQRQKSHEISVLRVQTVEKFFVHLASEDQKARQAALDSIAALGDEELAAVLAKHYGGEGGASVLARLSKSDNSEIAQIASKGLNELFSFLRQSIVVIRPCIGIFVSSDGWVLVPSSALKPSEENIQIEVPSTGM